jgi:hypothetical protein
MSFNIFIPNISYIFRYCLESNNFKKKIYGACYSPQSILQLIKVVERALVYTKYELSIIKTILKDFIKTNY